MNKSSIFGLVMNWELEALSLDAIRYRTPLKAERDALRDAASVYRKCAADLTLRLRESF